MFWWDFSTISASSTASFGNVFADYLDAGGAVVEMLWYSSANRLLGRYATQGYQPLVGADPFTTTTPASIGFIDNTSSIMSGVNSLTCTTRPVTTLATGAVLHAGWDDNAPLAASKGAAVSIAMELESSDASLGGDWAELVGNAIVEAAANSL